MPTFKNREDYLNQRQELLNKAEEFVNENKLEDFKNMKSEIDKLDESYKNFAEAQANLKAMQGNNSISNFQNASVKVNEAGVLSTFGNKNDEDFTNTNEYRKAFMNYVTKGTAMPSFENANANTKTSDVGSVIPNTILTKIIEKMEATGMILPLVTKTSYKGGVSVPTSSVKPVATWVAEGVGSDRQKKTTGSITFGAYKLRCAISTSLEVSVEALDFFETTFIKNVVEAMTKALEQSIITGTGVGQPKGILYETAVTGQNIDVAKADKLTYKLLCDAEGALPLAYENEAIWFMTKKTFMQFIALTDNNGQPVARVNYGLAGVPERTLLGRRVVLNDYMTTYDQSGSTVHVFGFLFNPSDYVVNTNYNMTVKRYEDNETDDQVTKAIMLVDGKCVDINSLVTLTKKNA